MDSRGVAAARRVLDQPRVTGAEDVLGPISQADLELAGENDDELAAGRRMPVEITADRILTKRDSGRRQTLSPFRGFRQINRLDVGFSIDARVEAERSHHVLPSECSEQRDDSTRA